MPFVVLPKASVTKHLVFESRWNAPVVQKRVSCRMELYTDSERRWRGIGEWEFSLDSTVWVYLVRDGGGIVTLARGGVELKRELHPPDLHKHTTPKEPMPKEGLFSGPSYLEYGEESKERKNDT
jgi:hypothetical protein